MSISIDGSGSIAGIDQGLNVVGVATYSTHLNVGGDLNVTGVLTYDDVTNIDSVGVITARSGLHVTGGNVGIGTDGPNAKLQISGGNANDHGDGILLSKQGGNIYGIYPSTNNLEFKSVTGNTHIATFEYGGNIGIGTDNANNLLHVYGGQIKAQSNPSDTSTNLDLIRAQCGSSGNALFSIRAADAADDNSNWDIKTNANEDLTFTIGGATEGLRITSTGNVGISTDNPGEKLTVNGSIESLCQVAVGSTDEGGELIMRAPPQQLTGTKYRYLVDTYYGSGSYGRASDDPVSGIRFVRQDDATEANGLIVCTMDEDGIVRHPYQPVASLSHSAVVTVNNTVLTSANFYDTTWINQGNHFSASTGRFTCPVAGVYRIYFRMSHDNTNVSTNVRLQKNGTTINEAYARVQYASVSSEAIVQCAADDYLQIQVADMFARGGSQHKQVTFQLLH